MAWLVNVMKAWAIKHWSRGLYPDTIRRTRAEAIECFMGLFLPGTAADRKKKWRDDSRYGVHRAVRVSVEIDSRDS
jgi:hypothetical protein